MTAQNYLTEIYANCHKGKNYLRNRELMECRSFY